MIKQIFSIILICFHLNVFTAQKKEEYSLDEVFLLDFKYFVSDARELEIFFLKPFGNGWYSSTLGHIIDLSKKDKYLFYATGHPIRLKTLSKYQHSPHIFHFVTNEEKDAGYKSDERDINAKGGYKYTITGQNNYREFVWEERKLTKKDLIK